METDTMNTTDTAAREAILFLATMLDNEHGTTTQAELMRTLTPSPAQPSTEGLKWGCKLLPSNYSDMKGLGVYSSTDRYYLSHTIGGGWSQRSGEMRYTFFKDEASAIAALSDCTTPPPDWVEPATPKPSESGGKVEESPFDNMEPWIEEQMRQLLVLVKQGRDAPGQIEAWEAVRQTCVELGCDGWTGAEGKNTIERTCAWIRHVCSSRTITPPTESKPTEADETPKPCGCCYGSGIYKNDICPDCHGSKIKPTEGEVLKCESCEQARADGLFVHYCKACGIGKPAEGDDTGPITITFKAGNAATVRKPSQPTPPSGEGEYPPELLPIGPDSQEMWHRSSVKARDMFWVSHCSTLTARIAELEKQVGEKEKP